MFGVSRIVRTVAVAVTLVALAACSAVYRDHGYVPNDRELAQIQVGVDTRESVQEAIGTPGTHGLLTGSGWYYVRSRFKHFAYNPPEEIDREVVAISFDGRGKVENIERFGLENGQVVVLSRRVTETNIKGVSFLKQLFRNIGRITPGLG
jgi:outer membrane protein assembly factor BamE (lipoprotein component of BamABCDE complex)